MQEQCRRCVHLASDSISKVGVYRPFKDVAVALTVLISQTRYIRTIYASCRDRTRYIKAAVADAEQRIDCTRSAIDTANPNICSAISQKYSNS
jgi:hypothetical protein